MEKTVEVEKSVIDRTMKDFNAGLDRLIAETPSIADRFECIGECVLVRRIEADDELTDGGIVKPEIARQRANRGLVLATGPLTPPNLHPGDIVRFSKYGGTDVDVDGETLLKLHWKQIHLREKCVG